MFHKYLEFFVSRLLGTGIDSLVLWICSDFLFHTYWTINVLSPAISFEFAVFSNFLCSYFWIWKGNIRKQSVKDFFGRFLISNCSAVAGFLIKMVFLLLFQKMFGWDVVICNLVALTVSGMFNFFADGLLFRKRSPVSGGK